MSASLGTGVIIPVLTPLDPGGEVDEASLRRLLDHLLDHGVDGVFLLGTSGEFGFLTDAQRVAVVTATVRHVDGRVPVLVGISDTATARAIEQARLLLPLGADAAVATAPFFAETGPLEIGEHFRRIAEAIGDVPLLAYENPPRVNGMSIPVPLLLDLAAEGVIAGVKDSSPDQGHLLSLLAGRSARGLSALRVLSGSETAAAAAIRAGADGLVPGLGNVDPGGYVELLRLARAGDPGADALQARLTALFGIVDIAPQAPMGGSSRALGAFKAACRLLGVIAEDRCAVPSVLLGEADRAAVAAVLAAHGPAGAAAGSARAARTVGP
ncbi:dihydrodipicolinate synthase family protein [Brachybacterium hainanense]|uniref:Dihydrodipicolinate synthase family protein n=1 Tax=Brachybacterium hainanense TaxID=1541174 RepID=A0ABV6RBG5_9MICO